MKQLFKSLQLGLLLVIFPLLTSAKHIAGGDFSMLALPNQHGSFNLTLSLYFDEAHGNFAEYETSITVYIFKKRDNVLVGSLVLKLNGRKALIYDNKTCAKAKQLNFSEVKYTNQIFLSPYAYTDEQGYYIIWDRCCRNNELTSLKNSGSTGMVFMIEFPALVNIGVPIYNSSPDFIFPNGDYVCIGSTFKMSFAAIDSDGDVLKYSLVEPLSGNASFTMPVGNGASMNKYPPVIFASGINVKNMIPGKPALSVDANTGEISVTATDDGLYIFTVLCEEYRNGEKIGSVRRDFQLPVSDCSKATPPVPVVYSTPNQIAQNLSICKGSTLTLFTDAKPEWSFAWKRNGINIQDGNKASITITEPGDYVVNKSLSNVCSNDTISQVIKVKDLAPQVNIVAPNLACNGNPIVLNAVPIQSNFVLEWQKNGQFLSNSNTITTNDEGIYVLKIRDINTDCSNTKDYNFRHIIIPTPLLVVSKNYFCEGDSLQINISNKNSDYNYFWQKEIVNLNTKSIDKYKTSVGGIFKVIAIDSNKCQNISNDLVLESKPLPVIKFDSLAAVCETTTPFALNGEPIGGIYQGKGINEGLFSPLLAGAGNHLLTYTMTNAWGCSSVLRHQQQVQTKIELNSPSPVGIYRESSYKFKLVSNVPNLNYEWLPPNGLDSLKVQNPTTKSEETILYKVKASSSGGCVTEKDIQVFVFDRLYFPNTFSPDNDGKNDTWFIENMENYTSKKVTIFDRWGEVIFESFGYSEPWDGTKNGQKVPSGLYVAKIKVAFETIEREHTVHLLVLY